MVIQKILKKQEGFSLILLIVFFSVIGVIAVTAVNLNSKIQKISQGSKTVNRVNVVRDALVKHYMGHQELPVDSADPNKIPVEALGLEQKYRLDAWGQYYHYSRLQNRKEFKDGDPQGELSTGIRRFIVDGQHAAAIIVSAGPNQVFDSFNPASPPTDDPALYPDTANGYSKGDDIYVPVNVQAEAINIAYSTLHSLARKICAYQAAPGKYISDLKYKEFPPPVGELGGHPGGAVKHLSTEFSLGENYLHDPWLQFYYFDRHMMGGTVGFFSAGPDRIPGNGDDLMVPKILLPFCANSGEPQPGARYPFDEGLLIPLSQIAHDVISGQDGTLGSDTNIEPFNDPTWSLSLGEFVMGDSALKFDGAKNYVKVDLDSKDFLNIAGAITLTAWVRPFSHSTSPDDQKIISRRSDDSFYFLGVDQGEPYGGIGDGTNFEHTPINDPANKIDVGKWYHLAFVYKNKPLPASMHMVVNGKEQPPVNASVSLQKSAGNIGLTIGADFDGNSNHFNGVIDDVTVYAQALTSENIHAIYNAPFPGKNAPYPSTYLRKDGVACYPFNNKSANDESRNGNDGTIYGATWGSIDSKVDRGQRYGNSSGAYTFNGAEYIDCGDDSSLQIEEFTIACWIYADTPVPGFTGISRIIAGGDDGANYALSLEYNVLGFQPSISFRNTSNTVEAKFPTPLSLGQWYHITGTYDRTNLKIYVHNTDGTLLPLPSPSPSSSEPSILIPTTTNPQTTFIGAAPKNGGGAQSFFKGTIDEVVIYNRALSSVEIEQLLIACPCIN